MKCSNCGTEFDGKFCPECGKPAQSTKVSCSNCGTEFEGNFCPSCGHSAQNTAQPVAANTIPPAQPAENFAIQTAVAQQPEESRFTGGAFANFFIELLTIIVSSITLFLAYPAMLCWKMRWETKHTYINGKQLTFDGKVGQLYAKYIIWLLLSIITLGLYYIFCMQVNLERWQKSHTHISGVENGKSEFNGSALGHFGVNLLCFFVTIITLSLGMYWARCYKERWMAKHTIIDGRQLRFDGKAIQYFGKRVLWFFLTIITIGIYSFWLIVKTKKWITKHTVFADEQLLPVSDTSVTAKATANTKPAANTYQSTQNTYQPAQNAYQPATTNAKTERTNGFAIAGFVLSFFFCVLGIIFSAIGLSKSKTLNNGKGLAIAGLVISIFFTVLNAIITVVVIVASAAVVLFV